MFGDLSDGDQLSMKGFHYVFMMVVNFRGDMSIFG